MASGVWRGRQVVIAAGAFEELRAQIAKVRERWGLGEEVRVVSCYEAGRDGFWLHRQLASLGIVNHVVDTASIEVSRRARRAKTDRLDAEALLEKLIRYAHGERRVWRVVRVPEPRWEDLRQLHRERAQLKKACTAARNRLGSKLVAQGIRLAPGKDFLARLETVPLFDGSPLPAHLKAGLRREYERLQLTQTQLRAVEREIRTLIESEDGLEQVRTLMLLPGIGWVGAWTLMLEIFGWRAIRNRRELAALVGLVATPYDYDGRWLRGVVGLGVARASAQVPRSAWGFRPVGRIAIIPPPQDLDVSKAWLAAGRRGGCRAPSPRPSVSLVSR